MVPRTSQAQKELQKAQVRTVVALTETLPLNDMGLPTGFYRLDLIDMPQGRSTKRGNGKSKSSKALVSYPEGSGKELQEVYQHAFVPLNYAEGFPTAPNGSPFWCQLDFEGMEIFQVFQLYLQLPTLSSQGVRQLIELPEAVEIHLQRTVPLQKIQDYFHLYYWQHRTKCYDLFREAARRKQQELRALEVNDNHFLVANQLMEKLKLFMSSDEDFWDVMTPKAAIDMLKVLTQLQRVSVGMPAMGPPQVAKGEEGRGLESLEVTLRTLAQGASHEATPEAVHAQTVSKMLGNPETAAIAQELIIKLNSKGNKELQQ